MTVRTKSPNNIKAFKEAREAVTKIQALVKYLTPGDLETLELLLDEKAISTIDQGRIEAKKGQLESIDKLV